MLTLICNTSHEGLAKFERRLGTIPLGVDAFYAQKFNPCSISYRTLATDRGFKERVREDMLVRLLDAFVWRNQGNIRLIPSSLTSF